MQLTRPQVASEYPSAWSFAMVFGVISPKIRTTIVMIAVDIVAMRSSRAMMLLSASIKNKVLMVDREMFTMLLPIRIVVISLS